MIPYYLPYVYDSDTDTSTPILILRKLNVITCVSVMLVLDTKIRRQYKVSVLHKLLYDDIYATFCFYLLLKVIQYGYISSKCELGSKVESFCFLYGDQNDNYCKLVLVNTLSCFSFCPLYSNHLLA
jgi:hypothetical protein